jgi:hypothetical protein
MFVLSFLAAILVATLLLDFLISRQLEQNYTDTHAAGRSPTKTDKTGLFLPSGP